MSGVSPDTAMPALGIETQLVWCVTSCAYRSAWKRIHSACLPLPPLLNNVDITSYTSPRTVLVFLLPYHGNLFRSMCTHPIFFKTSGKLAHLPRGNTLI